MKILIHALGATKGGAMRHLTNFLPELGKQDAKREYVVLVRDSFPDLKLAENIHLDRITKSRASGWIARIIGDLIQLPRRLTKEKFSAVVSLTNFGPIWSPVPHILFQRNPLYYCSYYLSIIRGREKAETILRRQLAIESMKRADLIVTPSNAMAEMIRETCPQVRSQKFRTLYHGYNKENLNKEPLNGEISDIFKYSGYKILYPTHPAPHKGFEILFEAMALLKQNRHDFALFLTTQREEWPRVVIEYERQIKKMNIENHVVFLGSVRQSQIGALYQLCDLMVYPSLCESFGFSMVEALHANLPIIAADTPVNREICGGRAIFYPPFDAQRLAELLIDFFSCDQKNSDRQSSKIQDSFDWSWQRYVKEFLSILEGYT